VNKTLSTAMLVVICEKSESHLLLTAKVLTLVRST